MKKIGIANQTNGKSLCPKENILIRKSINMANPEQIVWGIHADKTSDADNLFLKKGYIALGWDRMGDLNKLSADREAYKSKVIECYPEYKPGSIPGQAGQLFRFTHEMKTGDIVAYPSKRDRQVHIGKIVGPYKYDPSLEQSFPNLRKVDWLKSVPRTSFTQGALYEIGSAMSLFQIKTYSDEFVSAIEGKAGHLPGKKDLTIGVVAEDIEEITKDFILKQLSQELKGHPLEHFVAHLLNCMGYRTRVATEGADGGIDIIAHKDELGFEPPIIKVQVKAKDSTISDHEVSALIGNTSANEFGLFVTLGTFSNQATNKARSKPNIRLIDGDELVSLILQHYEQFDSGYKGVLPLKKVYVPEPIDESETE
jgi:restriction system protein